MISCLEAPDATYSRSFLADWLELSAWLSDRGQASAAELRGGLALEDDQVAEDTSVDLDERIEEIINEAFVCLDTRSVSAKGSYPFLLDGNSIKLTDMPLSLSQYVYLFCLVATTLRHNVFISSKNIHVMVGEVAILFQSCATVAAAGFLSGPARSFGFPRRDGSNFLDALSAVFKEIGEGCVASKCPPGFSQDRKDGGVDVIAWRPCPDHQPGQLFLLGQSASGKNWREKSVPKTQDFFSCFSLRPASPVIPAMFIPFSVDEMVSVRGNHTYDESRSGRYLESTLGVGIVLDRCRIPFFVKRGLAISRHLPEWVDGVEDMVRVREWVDLARKLVKDCP